MLLKAHPLINSRRKIMITAIHEKTESTLDLSALVTTPSDFDAERESLPMIVFLHGSGERGTDVEKVKLLGIPKYFCQNSDYLGLRVITVSPQCPEGTVWNNISIPLFDFIVKTAEKYNADFSAISITGLSMGGFGTWEMLFSHPDFFSAAAPICGGGMDWRVPFDLKTPVRIFHGECDNAVPVEYSKILYKALKERRASEASLTLYPNVGHNSWENAYEQTDLIEWLAAARRA